MDITFGIIGGLMHIVAYMIYNWQMLRGVSKPNAATWILWTILSSFNCVSYIIMTDDWIKGILPIASTTFCAVVFVISVFKGKLSKLKKWDSIALITGVFAMTVWLIFHSAIYANMILQFCILISFTPTIRGVWQNPKMEKCLPWFIWSSAYIINMIIVFSRWQGHPLELVYPINGMILHGLVGILALRRKKTPTLKRRQ